jgi:peroxidase
MDGNASHPRGGYGLGASLVRGIVARVVVVATSGLAVVAISQTNPGSFGRSGLLKSTSAKPLEAPPASPGRPLVFGLLGDIPPIDGSNHNLSDPAMNQAGTAEKRFLPNDYPDDQGDVIAGQDRPGARAISNAVFAQTPEPILNARRHNNLMWQFAQFLDHDFGISVEGGALGQPVEVLQIPVPEDDEFFPPSSTIDIQRFAFDPATGTSPGNPRAHINVQTGWIDASQVYGFGQSLPNVGSDGTSPTPGVLREFVDGRMLVDEENLLPRVASHFGPLFPPDLFLCGDFFPRCNETPGLTMMHTLFVREHNRKVAEFAAEDPSLSDEELFQLGRRWVTSLMQAITVNEFVPLLTGKNVKKYDGHKPSVNGRMALEFAHALFRVGHTLLTRTIRQGDGRPELDLGESLFQAPDIFQTSEDIDAIIRGFVGQTHEKLDCQVADGVRNFLVVDEPVSTQGFFFDLPAINVERGRELGLPSYNDAREGFGLPRVLSFSETFDADATDRLSSIYADPDQVDLFAGGICEKAVGRGHTGSLIRTAIHRQIEDVRAADRFWYQNVLSAEEIAEVNAYRLHDVIVNNSGLAPKEVQPSAFRVQ